MTNLLTIAAVDTFVFCCPLEIPVQTSFGIMQDRPMVLVRITNTEGICGWGEIWCNFPAVGAERRYAEGFRDFKLKIGFGRDQPDKFAEHHWSGR